ncbi:cytochrome P450 [Pelomonas sp. KK5]|uniref:cytochrome P450 n=1 Tax=Pelomonas sp. KK5 TaxID=1855730 RepID=UPI00097C6AE4|nr:cytochrome P450 [Pelomonas sp. KK5]
MSAPHPLASSSADRPLASLPGPRPLPLIGNLAGVELDSIHLHLERLAAQYGPLYRFHMGPDAALVVARGELIQEIHRERPEGFSRLLGMQRVINEIGIQGVFSAEGADWRRQRKLVMSAFDPGHLKRYFLALVRVTEQLRLCLDEAAASGQALDLQTLLMRYTVDVTTGLAFGIEMNTLREPDQALQGHLDKVFPMVMRRIFAPIPLWRYVRLPSDREFDRHLAKVHEAGHRFIAGARERMASDPGLRERPNNLLEALLAARDESGGGLGDAGVLGNVLTVLLAGEDTTANSLGWMLHLLHTHPAEWQAVVDEVDAALAPGEDMPREFDTARGFETIEACINEAMRLKPVAPVSLFEANKALSIGGVALKKGAQVIALNRLAAVNPELAGDAAQFRPQRWRASASAADHSLTKASIPFGAGPRLCPGRYLAMLEMKMVLATIARNYELISVATEDGTPPRERVAFTMFPVGLKLRVASRAHADLHSNG